MSYPREPVAERGRFGEAHVPLPWLRELPANCSPELRGRPDLWGALVSRLFARQFLLRKDGPPEVARADEEVARRVRSSLSEQQARALGKELHAFCSERLRAVQSER